MSSLDKRSLDSFASTHIIHDLCDGTRRFAVTLNRLPLTHTPVVDGNLRIALARWKQLEARLRKDTKLRREFKEKENDLIKQGTVEMRGTLSSLQHKFSGIQEPHNENILLPLLIVLAEGKPMRLVLDSKFSNELLYSGELQIPHVVDQLLRFRHNKFWASYDVKSFKYNVASKSTKDCMNALKCFFARKGYPKVMIADREGGFIRAGKEINRLYHTIDKLRIATAYLYTIEHILNSY